MKTLSEHWNEIFKRTEEDKLGWYENDFSQTVKFLYLIPELKNSKVFVSGVGTSGLIDILLEFASELVLNDLSSEAIERAKNKYSDKMHHIQWLCQDISMPLPPELNDIDVWVDRAVLHFLTDDSSVQQYFKNINAVLKSGGYALFAEFSKNGATRCAGLDVRRYDVPDLCKNLASFELVVNEEYTFINPNGDLRPYIYTLFKRVKDK